MKKLIIIWLIVGYVLGQIHLSAQIVKTDSILFKNPNENFYNEDNISLPLPTFDQPPKTLPLLKNDFIVNNFGGEYGSVQMFPDIAVNELGYYAVTWIDMRNGCKEIFAQFFNNKDQKIGGNILVSKKPNNWNSFPAIAASPKGEFIITWAQKYDVILAQRVTQNGKKIGDNFTINTRSGNNILNPSIAVNENGDFIIAWYNDYTGRYNLYARVFDADGNPYGDEITIIDEPDSRLSSIGGEKRVAADGKGNFAVVWSSYLNGKSRIFLQLIDSHGNKAGNSIMISDPDDSYSHYSPTIAATDEGYFMIIWSSSGDSLMGRIYNSDGYFVTDQFAVTPEKIPSYASYTISSDNDQVFLVFWSVSIMVIRQKFSISGEFSGPPDTLKFTSSGQFPSVSDILNDHLYLTFSKYRLNDLDIFLQKYDIDSEPVGNLTTVNDDSGSAWQEKPDVFFNDKGESVVLWIDPRNGRYDLYAQMLDQNFNPIGQNIQINDTPAEYWYTGDKTAAALSDGSFVIAFSGWQNYYDYNIYLQKLSPTGQKTGKNKLVMQSKNSSFKVKLKVNNDDQILLCWYDNHKGTDAAYLKKFDINLTPVSSQTRFIFQKNNLTRRSFTIAVNDSFNIFAAWMDYNSKTEKYGDKIYGLLYNDKGKIISDTILIERLYYSEEPSFLINAIDNKNNLLAFWKSSFKIHLKRYYYSEGDTFVYHKTFYHTSRKNIEPQIIDFRNHKAFVKWNSDGEVYAYFLNDNRQKLYPFLLYSYKNFQPYRIAYYTHNGAQIFKDKLLFAYESNQNKNTGYDIWANVQKFDSLNFEPELFFPMAERDVLFQNYPNPFRRKTTIVYEIYAFHKVKISVYDIRGRKVKDLINKNQRRGIYEIEFDASDLPSGIYFCRLEAFNTQVKKLVLIK
ncbi:MAG: T9SS type A sorting domain-containing protein [Calditrichaeota bacterium]|nr:T9SS type A sorting domain-containing protein [Calditrichota bacterium]